MNREKPRLVVSAPPDQYLVNALAALLVEDAMHPLRRLNLRTRHSGEPPEKPPPKRDFALIQGGRA